MSETVTIDGVEHDLSALSEAGRSSVTMIRFVDQHIAELQNNMAWLNRAKRSYLDVLEREIIGARSGVDFSDFLSN